MGERVVHPDYYNQGKSEGHTECIDLLDLIVEGYSGIAAFDLGQCKYLYRAGNKTEEGLSVNQKTLEDLEKNAFYLRDFAIRAKKAAQMYFGSQNVGNCLPYSFGCSIHKNPTVCKMVASEYSFFKEETLKPLVSDFIMKVMEMKTFDDLDQALIAYNKIWEEVYYQVNKKLPEVKII